MAILYRLQFDGSTTAAYTETLGNILAASTLEITHKDMYWPIPTDDTDYVVAQRNTDSANAEFGFYISNSAFRVTVGGATTEIGSLTALFGDPNVTIDGELRYKLTLGTGQFQFWVDGVEIYNDIVAVGANRIDLMPFFIGARSNTANTSPTGVKANYIAANTEMGEVEVKINDVVVRNFYKQTATGTDWPDTDGTAQDATVVGTLNWVYFQKITSSLATVKNGDSFTVSFDYGEEQPSSITLSDGVGTHSFDLTGTWDGVNFESNLTYPALGNTSGMPRYGAGRTLSVTNASGTVTTTVDVDVTDGFNYITLAGVQDFSINSLFYNWADRPIVGDQIIFDPAYYTVNVDSTYDIVTTAPTWSVNGFFIDDDGMEEYSVAAGAGGISPVTFTGTIPNQAEVVNSVVSLATSSYFSGSETPFTYSATGLPSGLSINTSTGEISGTVDTVQSTSVVVTATDQAANTADSNNFTFDVTASSVAVTFSGTVPDQNAYTGSSYSFGVASYFSGTETPFTYSLTGTLPVGLTLNTSTGVISGIPASAESQNVSVTATDQNTDTATTNTFTISVSEVVFTSGGTYNDDLYNWLGSLGYTGALPDRWYKYLKDQSS